jgi:TPR repeat protein
VKVLSSRTKEPLKYYEQAAQLGLAAAQFGLGEMYKDGHGVAQDFVPQSSLQKQQHWETFKHNME